MNSTIELIENFNYLMQEVPENIKICYTCQILKENRIKHCRYADKCIENYDHYCDFLQKPIGKGNHKLFVLLTFFNFLSVSLLLFLT